MSDPHSIPKVIPSSDHSNHSKQSIFQCHKCSAYLSLDPVQLEQIQKESKPIENTETLNSNDDAQKLNDDIQNQKSPNISVQCVFVDCPIRTQGLFECESCSQLGRCRCCKMPLCKTCTIHLKALSCGFCAEFICSQQCYRQIMQNHFEFMEQFGLSMKAHASIHLFRKTLLPPHLYCNIGGLPDECLPFHMCQGCNLQNCGCVDYIACVNCRGYFCSDCETNQLQKCALEECQSRTCCQKQEWDRNCMICERRGEDCDNIFCTKGHCTRHVIARNKHGFDFVEEMDKKVNEEQKVSNEAASDIANNSDKEL